MTQTQTSNYSILDHLIEGCQILDFDFRYLYVNEPVVAQGRKSREELLGHTMMELYPGIETTSMFSMLKHCMEAREPTQFENEFIYPDGTSAWFDLRMEPVPEGLFILSVDITARKRAELELQKQMRRVEALRQIDVAIISTTNLSLALRTVLQQVTGSLYVDAADILLFNPNLYSLEFAAGHGFRTRGIEKSQLRLGQGYAGQVAREKKMIVIPELAHCEKPFLRADLIDKEDFVSFFAIPLVSQGDLVGVLEIFHRSLLRPDHDWLNFLHALGGQASIAIGSGHLMRDLQRSNLDLMMAYDKTIEGWSKALDLRDKETEGHTLRVTQMTVKLAKIAGIPQNEMIHVQRGALLHDIGKMGVPDSILLKPGKLTDEEWLIMRKHPLYAYELLYPIEYLKPCLAIPYAHHEKWDGTGYPRCLKAEQIPLAARLFAVVDVWDALSNDRPYRQAWPKEKVLEHIRALSGTHFDPRAVALFLRTLEE